MSTTLSSSRYELLTATRYDCSLLSLQWNNDLNGPCAFLLLHYHLDRLIAAADEHGWDKAKGSLTYDTLKSICDNALKDHSDREDTKAFKIRLTLSETGLLAASVAPTLHLASDPTSASFFNPTSDNASLFGPVLAIYVDLEPIPVSRFTTTKTTQRAAYNEARARVGLPPPSSNHTAGMSDVLLYNSQRLITESSIFNVAFYHLHRWITPPVSTGCLPGVLRRWLLEQGRIHEADDDSLTKDSIKEGDWVLLFNGVQGCRLGRIAKF